MTIACERRAPMNAAALLLASCSLCASVLAQADWSRLPLTGTEPPNVGVAKAYDTNRMVLVARLGDGGPGDDGTWEWDGSVWNQVDSTPATGYGLMTFDPVRGKTILIENPGNDTPGVPGKPQRMWEWDGSTWTLVWDFRASPGGPAPRFDFVTAFDPITGELLLFGGLGVTVPWPVTPDTWTWNGTRWQLRSSTSAIASTRFEGTYHAVTDTLRHRVVIAGETSFLRTAPAAWTWDGSSWTPLTPSTYAGPRPPPYCGMAYDPVRDRIVSFGGTAAGGCNSYTIEFDGTAWVLRSPATIPPGRGNEYLWFDLRTIRVMAWGGACVVSSQVVFDLNLWSYSTNAFPDYHTIGPGCTTGQPLTLTTVDGTAPWLGDRVTVALSGEPANAPAWMATGFSDTQWGAIPLPLDLAFVGAPTCALRVEPLVWYPMSRNPQGRAEWSITIPLTSSLIGASFYNQAFVAVPGANPLGAVVSPAMQGVIGAR